MPVGDQGDVVKCLLLILYLPASPLLHAVPGLPAGSWSISTCGKSRLSRLVRLGAPFWATERGWEDETSERLTETRQLRIDSAAAAAAVRGTRTNMMHGSRVCGLSGGWQCAVRACGGVVAPTVPARRHGECLPPSTRPHGSVQAHGSRQVCWPPLAAAAAPSPSNTHPRALFFLHVLSITPITIPSPSHPPSRPHCTPQQ